MLPKGEHVFALYYHLLHNCRVFSLFFLFFKHNNQRWYICDNTFPVVFHSIFPSACLFLWFYVLGPWVSGTFTLYVCFIFWWRHWKGREQNSLSLQTKEESNLHLWFSCWMGFRRLKYYLLSTGIIILPTSLFKLTAEKKYKIKLKMFVLPLERRWKLQNFSLLSFAPPEVKLAQHLQFKLLFPEVNNSAVRLQSQFNIWQSFCLEIVPLEHVCNTFSQRVS